jgi:hypothetical protein
MERIGYNISSAGWLWVYRGRGHPFCGHLNRQIGNLVDAIAEGVATPAMKDRLKAAESEKAGIEAEAAAIDAGAEIVELHPKAIDSDRKTVAELQAALAGDGAAREEAMAIIRGLVTKIEFRPTPKRGKTEILVHGALAELINLATRTPGERVRTVLMVAGEGIGRDRHSLMVAI